MLNNIQYLRGIAAYLVVIGHTLQLLAEKVYASETGFIRHFEHAGAVGVDIFFVVSGFIMFYVSGQDRPGTASVRAFWGKRAVRVFPIYWILTTVVLAFYLTGIPRSKIEFSFDYLARSYLLIPVLGLDGTLKPIMAVGWTLMFEMFFYFVFGLMLLLAAQWRIYAVAGSMSALILLGLALPQAGDSSVLLATYTSPLMLEFLYGVLIARFYLSGHRLPQGLSLALVLIGFPLLLATFDGSETTRSLISGLPAAAIVLGAVMLEKAPWGWPRLRAGLQTLGDASYSLYLVHPVMLYGVSFAARYFPGGTPATGLLFFVVGLVIQTVASLVFYQMIEKPLTSKLQRHFFPRKA